MNTNMKSTYVRRFFLFLVGLAFLALLIVACQRAEHKVQETSVPPTTANEVETPPVVEEAPAPPMITEDDMTEVPASPEHITEHVSPGVTPRPAAPTATDENITEPEVETIYLETAEGTALEYSDDQILVVFYSQAVDGNLFEIFDDNGMPSEEADIEVSYLFDRQIWSPAYTNALYACALQDVRGELSFVSCLEGYEVGESEETVGENLPTVPVSATFEGPDCHLAVNEIEVYARQGYNTIDLVVNPEQGVVNWSSTNMSKENFWRQHSYRDENGCSVLTIGHDETHPTGINFVVTNSAGQVIWDQDLWLGD